MRLLRIVVPILLLEAACIPPDNRGASRLTGTWYATDTTVRLAETDAGLVTDRMSDRSQVIIREDGSFDLANTMLGLLEGVGGLRRVGDRVYYSQEAYLEVKSATYLPGVSEIVISDSSNQAEILFRVELVAPERALLVGGSFGGESSRVVVVMNLSREERSAASPNAHAAGR